MASTSTDNQGAARVLFYNASVLDAERGQLFPNQSVLVEGERITRVGQDQRDPSTAEMRRIDVRGRTLMPGLIDCHVHVTAATANLDALYDW